MKKPLLIVFIVIAALMFPQQATGQTFCNPLNISYRFTLSAPSRRTAADPTIVLYKDYYYLFATQSGGYWYSPDLLTWNFVTTPDLPFELDAPTAVVIKDSLYYIPLNSNIIYRAIDPVNGKWEKYNSSFPLSVGDPAIFVDTDNKVYLYYGCSTNDFIKGIELDVNNKLNPKGTMVNALKANQIKHGWERPGDYNTKEENPWVEAPWMTKYNGKYYLQYSAPGTEYKSYADGYYVSDNPLGPFTYATNNPFSAKPEGFINGAGHGSTFQDKYGNWWHIATMSISVKEKFERRLGLFPVTFDAAGKMIAHTEFGDLPMIMPNYKYTDVSELFPGWMMLSYKKNAEASSSLSSNPTKMAFDENVRDYWSAKTGNKGEWLSVDLGSISTINAVQINFAENNTQLFGRTGVQSQQYLLEYSTDKQSWQTLVDKTTNNEDLTHQYHAINSPVQARYLRITNYRVPGGTFAISGFRVFGNGTSEKPTKVRSVKMYRNGTDARNIKLLWNKQPYAIGYNIRFGTQADKLYRSYQVYNDTTITIRSLDIDQRYWFAIDAFGEKGITTGDTFEGITSNMPGTIIEAENFSGKSGVQVQDCTEGGSHLAFIGNGSYSYYNNVNFGSGVYTLDARVAAGSDGGVVAGTIEVRSDSPTGTLLGVVSVPGTRDWQNYTTVSCNLTGALGVKNLYLVYRIAGGFNLNWIRLRDNSSNNQVSLFQQPDFAGSPVNFGVGSYTTANLAEASGNNNSISSVRVPIGWEVILYDGDNFTGSSVTLQSDNSNLLSFDFIDRTSSLKIRNNLTAVENLKTNHLAIYPNPVKTSLFIDGLNELTDVQISNISGQVIFHTKTTRSIDVSKLNQGVYFIQVNKLNKEIFKIVKC